MSGLTPPERIAIGMVEDTEVFRSVDHSVVASNAATLQQRFKGVSNASLARLLLMTAIGLENAIMSSEDPEMQVVATKAFCVELQILAATVTRKDRGLPPLGVNGGVEPDGDKK